ncbi:hypothetical protein GCM10025734_31350 [Kitasatospora paranensis]|uniref:hypothetical protein n=1 Tax=Kitasatospora paranensis TaxID=258053 RepID=UPI0031E9C82F
MGDARRPHRGLPPLPEYLRWRELLHHFYDPFPAVEHYGEPVLTAPPAAAEG